MRFTANVCYRTTRKRKNEMDRQRKERGFTLKQYMEAALDATYDLPRLPRPYETHPGGGPPKGNLDDY